MRNEQGCSHQSQSCQYQRYGGMNARSGIDVIAPGKPRAFFALRDAYPFVPYLAPRGYLPDQGSGIH